MICNSLKECFLSDIRYIYPKATLFFAFKKSLLNGGISAVVMVRVSQYLFSRRLLWRLSFYIARINQILNGFECNLSADIGPGLIIPHPQGIVIGEESVIGENVTIYNGVTLGAKKIKNTSEEEAKKSCRFPTVEDYAVIYTGAKCLGPITIGKHATVGANAVVFKDVPTYATAVGIPAKIIESL